MRNLKDVAIEAAVWAAVFITVLSFSTLLYSWVFKPSQRSAELSRQTRNASIANLGLNRNVVAVQATTNEVGEVVYV